MLVVSLEDGNIFLIILMKIKLLLNTWEAFALACILKMRVFEMYNLWGIGEAVKKYFIWVSTAKV